MTGCSPPRTIPSTDLSSTSPATVHWPACTFYTQLMAVYPQAKVLLTVRDPDQWYTSVKNTIYQPGGPPAAPVMPPAQVAQRHMINSIIWEHTFDNRFEDKEHA